MSESTRFDVTVARRVPFVPKSAALYRRLEKFVAALPAHRDTRSGRRNATQIRVVLMATGILTVVLWPSPWAPVALLLCFVALVLPISESKRRSLVAQLRAKRSKQKRVERTAGIVEVSDTHITLLVDEDRVRRLRRRNLAEERDEDELWFREGQKKANALALCSGSCDPDLDAWAEEVPLAEVESAMRS